MKRRRLLSHLYRSGVAVLALGLAAVAAPAKTQVKEGGTMVVALPGDPPFINSSIGSDISSSNLSGQIYATMVQTVIPRAVAWVLSRNAASCASAAAGSFALASRRADSCSASAASWAL